MTELHETEERSSTPHWLDWAPIGIWNAGVLAALRAAILIQAEKRGGADDSTLAWEVAGQFPPVLAQALVVGLATAALLASARAQDPARMARVPFFFTATFFWSVLSGWPLAPENERSHALFQPALDDAGLQALLALALAFATWRALALAERPLFTRWLRGPLGLLVAALGAAALPSGLACQKTREAPTYTRRVIVHDFLEAGDYETLSAPTDAPPEPTVITPVVAWETDSGDKPALRMAPSSRVRLTVPDASFGGRLYLRAAAGVHKSLYDHMPEGFDELEFTFRIERQGGVLWEQSILCERPTRGVWDPSKRVWRHAGDDVGLPVAPGDEIVLATDFTAPDAAAGVSASALRIGFGGLAIEEEIVDHRTRATPQDPNIVLIVMDTQRADRMSCYGYDTLTTPNLDRLASRGILFENAYATSSWTWPSTASILTGLAADSHGVTSNESCTLARSLTSLPEALQDAGYKTAAFACNPLIARERYFDQGFEDFEGARDRFWMTDEVADDVLGWLDANRNVRFFLYLHLADPHTPHKPHEEELERLGVERPADLPEGGMQHYEGVLAGRGGTLDSDPAEVDALVPPGHQRWLSDVYDASVATGDRYVGEFLRRIDALGLSDRTVIAFTGDHGEELLERGALGHGHTLNQELVHIPLLLAGPGIPAGVRNEAIVSNRHLAPTLARLGGTRLQAAGDEIFLVEADPLLETSAFVQTEKGLWDDARGLKLYGLRKGPWFLHWRPMDEGEPKVRLFDLRREGVDVAGDDPERAKIMLAEGRERLEEQQAFAPEVRTPAGGAATEMLEQIGYAGKDGDGDE